MSTYTDAICQDIRHSASLALGRPLRSIFFGGGTPSLFPEASINRILDCIRSHFTLSRDCEITLEMNPSSFEIKKMRAYVEMGINRLSIGVQSFHEESLRLLGRTHDPQEALLAVDTALSLPFSSVNVDLMYALPQQTLAASLADLQQVITLAPPHISWYELTIEANTYFAKYRPNLPDDELQYAMYQQGIQTLRQHGYERYEISAFAQTPMLQCQHNLNYWQFDDYLGCGNGASSKITMNGRIKRFQKYRNPGLYQANPTQHVHESIVSPDALVFEYMLNRMRLLSPIPWGDIQAKTMLSDKELRERLAPCINQGYLEATPDDLSITEKGQLFMNDCQALLIS